MIQTMEPFHPVPTRELPENYVLRKNFNAKDPRTSLAMNANGLAAFFLFAWLFFIITVWLRPVDSKGLLGSTFTSSGLILRILGVLVLMLVLIYIHEGIHGLFFWLATRTRPVFGFRVIYAYAAAPDWYIPRDSYMLVGLAPFVVISAVGVFLLAIVPAGAIAAVLLFVVMNASGSVGDLMVTLLLLRQPADALACDKGDEVRIYAPNR